MIISKHNGWEYIAMRRRIGCEGWRRVREIYSYWIFSAFGNIYTQQQHRMERLGWCEIDWQSFNLSIESLMSEICLLMKIINTHFLAYRRSFVCCAFDVRGAFRPKNWKLKILSSCSSAANGAKFFIAHDNDDDDY